MHVYQREGSVYWYYRFKVKGVQYRGSTERTKKPDALAKAAELRAKVIEGKVENTLVMTLREAADWYLKGDGKSDVKNNTSRIAKLFGSDIKGTAKRHGLSPALPIHQLTNSMLDTLKKARIEEKNSLKTINRELSLVQSLVKEAKLACARLPEGLTVAEYKTPETGRKGRKLFKDTRRRAFTEDEEEKFLAALDPTREMKGVAPYEKRKDTMRQRQLQDQYDLAVFLFDTGGRYGEGAGVMWDCVNFEGHTVNLYRDKVGEEGTLPMTERLKAVLIRRWNARRGDNLYIFGGFKKNDQGPRGYSVKGFRNAIDRLNLNAEDKVARSGRLVPAHSMRHTFATRLLMGGLTDKKVSSLLGHTDTKMVNEHYGHLLEQDVAHEAKVILDRNHEKRKALPKNVKEIRRAA